MSLSPGLRSGDAAGVGLPRGSRCGRDVPGTARSLHLLEAGAEGCREPSAPGMVWGIHGSLLLALLLCPARWLEPTGAGGSCGCVTAKGFWCCSASSPCKELGDGCCSAWVLAARVSGAAPVPCPTGCRFAALSWQGAGRAPRRAAVLQWPRPLLAQLGALWSGQQAWQRHGVLLDVAHWSIQTVPAAKGKRGKKGMGREDRAAAALRLDQCRPSGNLSQISGPGACAC